MRYNTYIDSKGKPEPTKEESEAGKALFSSGAKPPCATCHTIAGTSAGQTGPELTHIATVAAQRVADPAYVRPTKDAASYLRESIVAPNAFIVPQCPSGQCFKDIMPQNIDNPVYTNAIYASAEIFNPATGAWVATGSMALARSQHTATRLGDGRVLVVSGTSAEIFNPASGAWVATGNLGVSRGRHTATLLADGRVLVVGGIGSGSASLASAEIFNPASGTWAATGNLGVARADHAAVLLGSGQVLVAGGATSSGGSFTVFTSAEIFNPATGAWAPTGNLGSPRALLTATRLSDGRVLAVGGLMSGSTLRSTEIFNPATGAWSAEASMISARNRHTATALNDGRLLAVGGGGDGSGICCAEVFALSGGGTPTATPAPASITVGVPNGGEIWRIGSARTVQWSTTGSVGNVSVLLSRDGGATYTAIASNIPNSGSFAWVVSGPTTAAARIRVASAGQPAVLDASNSNFSIRR